MQDWLKKNSAGIFFVALVLPFIVLVSRPRYFAPTCWDERAFLWQGWMILKGLLPYRDFFEVKPPVIFFANALGLKWFGLEGGLYRIIPVGLAALGIIFFYGGLIRHKVTPFLVALLTIQLTAWLLGPDFHDTGPNDTETYGLSFCLLALGLILGSSRLSEGLSDKKRFWVRLSAGFCLGLAVLSKELFMLSAVPVGLISGYDFKSTKWKKKDLLPSLIGSLAIGCLFLVYLFATSSLISYLEELRFSLHFASNYCVSMGLFPAGTQLQTWVTSLDRLSSKFFNFQHLQFILPLAALGVWFNGSKSVLALILLSPCLGMLSVSAGHCFWNHYFCMTVVGVLIPAIWGSRALSNQLKRFGFVSRSLIWAAFSALLLNSVWPTAQDAWVQKEFHFAGLPVDAAMRDAVQKLTQPNDPILETGDPGVYVALNRMGPIHVMSADEVLDYYLPGRTDEEKLSSFHLQMELNPPKVIHIPLEWRKRQRRTYEHLYRPFILKHSYIELQKDELWVWRGA